MSQSADSDREAGSQKLRAGSEELSVTESLPGHIYKYKMPLGAFYILAVFGGGSELLHFRSGLESRNDAISAIGRNSREAGLQPRGRKTARVVDESLPGIPRLYQNR
jgi:hypothetical protein